MNKTLIFRLATTVLPVIVVAVLGTIFVNIGMPWFESLAKPSQWIPNFVIPLVWTVIYFLFAIVLFLWQGNEPLELHTFVLLVANGALNVLWCFVFFALKLTFLGNIVIIFNLIAGFLLVSNTFKTNKLFGYALAIYPVWLSIATTLNLAIWILN